MTRMKTLVQIVLLLLLVPDAPAQLRLQQAELQVAPGALLQTYTRDSLVFERRRGRSTLAGSTHFLLQTQWGAGHRWQFGAGLGLRTDRFTMNRLNAVDGFFAIVLLPFSARPFADTLPLEQIKMRNRLLSVPLSVGYYLTARPDALVRFQARLQVIPSFLLSARAAVETESGSNLSQERLAQVQQTYTEAGGRFAMLLAPELNMQLQFPKSPMGLQVGLQPLAFDVAQTTRRFLQGNTHLRLSASLLYRWHSR